MPAPKRGQSIEPSDEREDFLKKLAEYHEQRGTTLDTEPKVGVRHIDLFKLYNRVVEEGGYDLVSDTKAKPLMWRKFAEEFVGKNQYTAAQAFQVKNIYYKNLCAFEIKHHWDKEPPPKEILEEVTAKGGGVMTRTLENFTRPMKREEENLQNGDASDASPEQRTPKEEKSEAVDEPGSATGRSTRGLRQQPPQRVLFQPEVGSGRQTRNQNQASHASPTPGAGPNGVMNASSLTNGASSTLASYEPSQAYPLSLKPVITPANNPDFYRNERKRKLEANAGPLARKYRNIMLPGTGFIGPNIYMRAQLAVQSGIPDEEQYALHHLVKISHERGDKYRFDQFPGLADALTKKVLQVTGLFYDVEWDVMYDEEFFAGDDETLNGLDGTPDILQKLQSRIPIISNDSILDSQFLSHLNRITEAALVIRNMALQEENAAYLSRLPLVRDLLAVVLNLPHHPGIVELQHYALDISEQVLKYVDIGSQDAVYKGLLAQAKKSDRGAVATALRAISRIAMTHPAPKRLDNIPTSLLKHVQELLLLEDEELRAACLDFLGQFTSTSDNVETLLRTLDAEALARHLSRLTLFTAKEHREQRSTRRQAPDDTIAPVPRLAKSLVEQLLKMDEPDRSSEWLRMCFIQDPTSEMTQISLWQAYQGTFAPYHATHPHLIAGEFIKNVSNTFQGATAQVAGSNKYVIKGIKARKAPVDTGILAGSKPSDKGKELYRCRWKVTIPVEGTRDPVTGMISAPTTREIESGEWFRTPEDMMQHILKHHLRIPKKQETPPDGDKMEVDSNNTPRSATPANSMMNGTNGHSNKNAFDFEATDKTTHRCRWADCERTSADFGDSKLSRTLLFARHIETHLPETEPSRSKHNVKPEARPPPSAEFMKLTLLEDEKGEATGVPLRAVVVLRNLARFMPKQLALGNGASAIRSGHKKEEKTDLLENVFDGEVRERLFHAMSYSRTMRDYVGAVFGALKQSEK